VLAHDEQLRAFRSHWLGREIMGLARRVMKRLDVTSRTLIALVDSGSCFGGLLAELLFVADRTYMRDAEEAPPRIAITETNFGVLPTLNGLSRLATRFLGDPSWLNEVKTLCGHTLDPREALTAGLITYAPDDIDWDEEIRLLIEERASFSPDALSGMEANLRFPGPETMESKIFGRLSAWQNWIFSRPNVVGPGSALSSYGTGRRPKFDLERT
jgi:benzoyl-CoA-dihydrodiol lyase